MKDPIGGENGYVQSRVEFGHGDERRANGLEQEHRLVAQRRLELC